MFEAFRFEVATARRGRGLRGPMALAAAVSVGALGCASSDDAGAGFGGEFPGDSQSSGGTGPGGAGGGVNLGVNGAQDVGQFRHILDAHQLPGPETLDSAGFFAEHHTELPPPECDGAVCLQTMLGVRGNMLNGAPCTLLQVGMNTRAVDAAAARRPLHLAVVLDTSGSMNDDDKLAFVQRGLHTLVDTLGEEDQLALVTFSSTAQTLRALAPMGDRAALHRLVDALAADGGTNLHDGLRAGLELLAAHADAAHESRVVLLSDGEPTVGVTDVGAIVTMARPYVSEGIGVTTIGVGLAFNPVLMRTLAEQGSGNFYFLDDQAAIEEVFTEELDYFVTPLARELELRVKVGSGYRLREVYGTNLWQTEGQWGVIRVPAVFVAHRRSHDDQAHGGRRGGGGAILLELVPVGARGDLGGEGEGGAAAEAAREVARVTLSYVRPGDSLRHETEARVVAPETAAAVEGAADAGADAAFFSHTPIEKHFVMLNVFVGLRLAASAAARGELRRALGVLRALEPAVAEWNAAHGDEDIEDDLGLVRQFMLVLQEHGADATTPELPEDPWPAD